MQLTVTITMGNDAMQTGEDLADALRRVAKEVEDLRMTEAHAERLSGRIRDVNGNTVGGWSVTGTA
jgi:hypothetical protein